MEEHPIIELPVARRWRVGDFIFQIDEANHTFTVDGSRFDRGFGGSHRWDARGGLTLRQFLIGMTDRQYPDRSYFMEKLFPSDALYEFSWEETRRNLIRHTVEGWREGAYKKEEAHEIIDALRWLGDDVSEEALYRDSALSRLIPHAYEHRSTVDTARANACWKAFCRFTEFLKANP